MNAFQQVLDR
jgi:hypothetical protein